MSAVAIVVPCFNEERRLDVDAFTAFALNAHDTSIHFVDDGSTDDTLHVLERIARDARVACKIVRLESNAGKAEAVRRGVIDAISSKPDYVGYWDADLATPLDVIGDFATFMDRNHEVDIVFGARVRLMGRSIERHAWRHYIGRVNATIVSQLLRLPIYDTQAGHKLFRRTAAFEQVFAEPFLTKWLFDVEILARFLTLEGQTRARAAAGIYEWPLTRWVDVRGSKVRSIDFVRSIADLATIKRHYRL